MSDSTEGVLMSVGVAIITHNAKHHLRECLPPYLHSPLHPRVVVVNSSSNDGTVEEAERLGAETLVIPRHEFNHGSTRERARQYLNTDIVVMATPDAYPVDDQALGKLVAPLLEGEAAVAYARQIPHHGADFFEAFPREFNYPTQGQRRTLADVKRYGVYTFFCSDSCAAYLNSALNSVGGFAPVLVGEDTVATAKLLKEGHAIRYVAEAVVRHSHRYTLVQEFRRYFDTGLARASYGDLLADGGSDERRGLTFFTTMMKHLGQRHPWMIPYGCLQTAAKWSGYRLGKICPNAPLWIKKALSGQDFYWSSYNP